MEPVRMGRGSAAPKSLTQRLGWLVLIWAASIAVLGVIAWSFRWVMALAGLTL